MEDREPPPEEEGENNNGGNSVLEPVGPRTQTKKRRAPLWSGEILAIGHRRRLACPYLVIGRPSADPVKPSLSHDLAEWVQPRLHLIGEVRPPTERRLLREGGRSAKDRQAPSRKGAFRSVGRARVSHDIVESRSRGIQGLPVCPCARSAWSGSPWTRARTCTEDGAEFRCG